MGIFKVGKHSNNQNSVQKGGITSTWNHNSTLQPRGRAKQQQPFGSKSKETVKLHYLSNSHCSARQQKQKASLIYHPLLNKENKE